MYAMRLCVYFNKTDGLLCMYRLPIYVGLWIHRF